MYKLLGVVALLATMSFADQITIDLDKNLTKDGWDHYKASLIQVNLASYLGGKELTSAVLKFEDVQNMKEPETNDSLHISLLKLNSSSKTDLSVDYFTDDQKSGNYFRDVKKKSVYSWVKGQSEVAPYYDNNDGAAKYELAWKPDGWEGTNPSQDWRYEGYYKTSAYSNIGNDVKPSDWDTWYYSGGKWGNNGKASKYGKETWGKGALWSKISAYKTENFDRILDIADVNALSENGWLGIGLDADCHYTGKISLVIETKAIKVPEPGMLSLLGCSLLGLLFIRRKK